MRSSRYADESACLRSGRSSSWPGGPPRRGFLRTCGVVSGRAARARGVGLGSRARLLPAGLGDARQFAAVRHGAEADTAEAELAVHGPRPPAARAARVAAHSELRLPVGLDDQRRL